MSVTAEIRCVLFFYFFSKITIFVSQNLLCKDCTSDRLPAVLVGNERLMGSDKRLRNSKY